MSKPKIKFKAGQSVRLRVGNWFNMDTKEDAFVVEISTKPRKWNGLMINGSAQVFKTEQEAKDKIASLKADWNL